MPRKKVKDMPRKQQMAVKASMAEQAAGKKSPAKKNKDYVDFNNPKVEKNYKENPEFRKYLKEKKGVTYDAKTRVSKTVKPMARLEDTKKKTSPALAKLSASCKAAARKKFKVYPSAYANMWASKTQKAGKC